MKPTDSLFSGLTILDLTQVYSGPLATRLFADYGATVIKIEHPVKKDPSRNYPPIKHQWSGYFEILNRNKQCLELDLKAKKDKRAFLDLVKKADILVENYAPKTKTKLGIDYSKLHQLNPQLIYASLAGLDQNSNRKYFDLIAQAESGLMSLTGIDKPTKIGPAVVDAVSGYNLAFAISSALYYRQRTGKGQWLSVSMLATAINLLEQNLIAYSVNKQNPKLPGNQDAAIAPFGIYQTKDSYIALAAGSDHLWQRLADYLQSLMPHPLDRFNTNVQRLRFQPELTKYIESCFSVLSTKKLIKELKAIEIPCAAVAQMSDVAVNKWFTRHKAVVSINHPKLGTCLVPGHSILFSATPLPPIQSLTSPL